MTFIFNRLREPSTWAGVASLIAAFGIGVPPGTVEAVAQLGAGIAGLGAIFLRERGQ